MRSMTMSTSDYGHLRNMLSLFSFSHAERCLLLQPLKRAHVAIHLASLQVEKSLRMRLPNRAFILTPRSCFVGWTEVNASSTTKPVYCLTLFSSASLKKRSFCVFSSLTDYQRHPRDVSELHVITSRELVALRRIKILTASVLPCNVRRKSIF